MEARWKVRASLGQTTTWSTIVLALSTWFATMSLAAQTFSRVEPSDFHFTRPEYNVTILENSVGKTYTTPVAKMGMYITDPTLEVKYRIISGDSNKQFKAEHRSIGDFCFLMIRTTSGGTTVINRELQERFTLVVKAKARYKHGAKMSTQTQVLVQVNDANDLSPLFYPTSYAVQVPENKPTHASIARVSASDADIGVNGEVYYSFAQRTEVFAIHPTSGVVTLTRPLRYDEQNYYELDILARDRGPDFGPVHRTSRAALRIRVQEVNFHSPEVTLQELPSVIEHGKVGTVYAILYVHDRDIGQNGEINSVAIIGGDPHGFFRLTQGTRSKLEHNIVVAQNLDREIDPYGFNLTIRASDNGRPPRTTTETVHVKLQDTNDQTPRFRQEHYSISVHESVPVYTPMLFVNATDIDYSQNGEIVYSIASGNTLGWFRISPYTGLLSVASALDYETRTQLELTIRAEDQGNMGSRRVSQTFVAVQILDDNDNTPLFNHTAPVEVHFDEGQPVGTKVFQVFAHDADRGGNGQLSYSIANVDDVPFTVDHVTGEIFTTAVLDYESMRHEFNLQIRASDWGRPFRREAELILKVSMRDVNDNKPQFEKVDCQGYLSREAPIGTSLVVVSAIDFEVTNIISYQITSGNDNNCFEMQPSTGLLRTTCDFTKFSRDFQSIGVTATDSVNRATPTTVNVTFVNNRNTHLANQNANFNCRDTGVSGELTRLMKKAEENHLFEENEVIHDGHAMFMQNANTPRFPAALPAKIRVRERRPVGERVLTMEAQDADHGYNGRLMYVIAGGNEGDTFKVDTYSGELLVLSGIDREVRDKYTLNVTVTDMGSPPRASFRMLDVEVEDVNDNAPAFEKPAYSSSIREDVAVGATVVKVSATDEDIGNNAVITYSILTDTDDFVIDPSSGQISVGKKLDRERVDEYTLRVRAADRAGVNPLAVVVQVKIKIEDVNDNPPRFFPLQYRVRAREDLPVGTVILTITAHDPDAGEGGKLRYSLQDGMDDKFEIDRVTGTVRIARELDFEQKQIYNMTARARDRGEPSMNTKCDITVEVVDVNENLYPPRFRDSVFVGRVKEKEPINTLVLQLMANDLDRDNPHASQKDYDIVYSIRDGSGLGRFTIDKKGYIRTTEILDRESETHYWLTVYAQDRGTIALSSMVEVLVQVDDINDNMPQTVEPVYYPAVMENSPEGTSVVRLQAQDLDDTKNNQLSYKVTSGDPQGFFHIDDMSGLITTSHRKLNRERDEEHTLEVTVVDSGVPPLSSTTRVVVTVADDNDESPEFTELLYRVRIPEMPQGSHEDMPLHRVVAFDRDIGANGDIDYSIVKNGAKGNGRFKIHPKTGTISSDKEFVRGNQYDVTVKAIDNGRPQRENQTRVLFNVVPCPSESANPPRFLTERSSARVMELDVIGHMVTLMSAEDPDQDKIWYSITGGNVENIFSINTEGGNIILARQLDWETQNHYNLTVSATDCVNTVYTWVEINVLDNNDNRPQFSQATYLVDIAENLPEDTEIFTVSATDRDEDKRLFYSIHSSTDQASRNKFKINSETDRHGNWTGVITTLLPLDREAIARHELTIMVRDQGMPSKRSYARVIINIVDQNDHRPRFLTTQYEGRVFESAAIGSSVLQVMGNDRDHGKNAEIKYSIVSGNIGSAFHIDQTLGIISTAKILNKISQPEYDLVIKASDGGSPSLSSTVPVMIQVTMANNAPPRFLADEYTTELEENSPPGSHVIAVEAVSRSSVVYDIIKGDDDFIFVITPNSGVISNNFAIDYEQYSFFNLTVKATNMVGVSVEVTVLIHILDVNDNRPVFTQSLYIGNISEVAAVGSVILGLDTTPLVVKATDNDTNQNALLVYRIVEPDAREVFDIDANTGAIRTKVALDHEVLPLYKFSVQVSDSGSPQQSAVIAAKVNIHVADINDSPPEFPQNNYETTLLLSDFEHLDFPAYKDVVVLRVVATDPDLAMNSPLVYDIVSGNDHRHFVIDAKSGVITVASVEQHMLDNYELVVRVTDGKFQSQARVKVHVDFTNDSGLSFSEVEYYAEIQENVTGLEQVAVVQAVGHSLNEHLRFSILNPSAMFSIGETSGVVQSTGKPFDREMKDNYTLTIQVEDHRMPPRIAHAVLNVKVLDMNDNAPVFVQQPYFAIVSIDAAKGEVIKKVTAIDRDIEENGHVTYSLMEGGDGKFTINQNTGQILVNKELTLEDQNMEYKLIIEARDKGEQPLFSTVTVPLTIMNEATPVFSEPYYSVSVPENVPLHSAILTIEANSPKGRKLIYSITRGDDYGELSVHFETDMDVLGPCSITVQELLDYELKKHYELTVRATDFKTGTYSETVVHIRLEDVNDNAPSFTSLAYINTVSEAVPIGTSVLTVSAVDADMGSNAKVHYTIQAKEGEEVNDSNYFHIDSDKGTILIKQKLDRETASLLHFEVVATDSGLPSLSSSVSVTVVVHDLNDNAPSFEQPLYEVTVTDQIRRGQFITKVMASDADSSDAEYLAYSIVGGNARNAFAVGEYTGVVTVSSLRKPDLQPSYTLNISVTDSVFTNFARVVIKVEYSNNNVPTFSHTVYDVDVVENAPAGAFVTTVVALDDDPGKYGTVTYAIESEDAGELFRINKDNGKLYTRRPLDREEAALYSVPVVARDGGGRAGYTMIHVNVADQADHRPQFRLSEFKANVYATADLGHPIVQVAAIDMDLGSNGDVDYNIYGGESTQAAKYVEIEANTGIISLKQALTGLENTLFQFFVRARDRGSPPQHSDVPVDVYVMGAENYPPIFPRDTSEYFVHEDHPVGSVIASVTATSNESLVYSIVHGDMAYTNNPPKFTIDHDGKISILEPLDRETTEKFELTVKAETKTSPPLAAFTQTIIQIRDRNDNSPKFESSPYVVAIVENAEIGSKVIQVVAKDKDIGANADITYEFASDAGDFSNVFAIDSQTGWLTTVVELDRETVDRYVFGIVASDRGSETQLSDMTTVRITVMDNNDEPPVFSQSVYQGAVNEDALPGTIILVVTTTDRDLPDNARVTYSIKDGDPLGQFNMRNTGQIYVNKALDREVTPFYQLDIVATDGAFVSTARVRLTILDANDNAPHCAQPIYQSSVSETMPPGFIAQVNATDADEAGTRNARITFSLSGDYQGIFSIQERSGILTTRSQMDREVTPEYHLIVTASDGGGLTCTTDVYIILKDENDNAPVFSQGTYTVQISEAAEVSSLLTRVSATDADAGIHRKVRYTLDTNERQFEIEEDSGIVSLSRPLDRELKHQYNITVYAYDLGTPRMTSKATLIIWVLDVNDNPPTFERTTYELSQREDTQTGTSILRVFATSRDTGINAEISYKIIGGNELGCFNVDSVTGELLAIKTLDYETVREFVLTVEASDGGTPSLSTTTQVNINITDANDNPPSFAQDVYRTSIVENIAPLTKVIQVVATDLDSAPNSKVLYEIADGDNSSQFHISPAEGYITVATDLDRESIASYSLVVHSVDSGEPPLTGSVTVTIDVLDVNDSPPRFGQENYTAVLQENKQLGFHLIQLDVFDDDLKPNGAPFTFDIVGGNEGYEFHIDNNGAISTAAKFNRQVKDTYDLNVRVFDNGEPTLHSDVIVTVVIIEESAFPPIVTPLSVTVTAFDDEFPGGVIGRVKAIDRDPYDTLSYAVVSDNQHLFDIHSLDGTLKAVQSLDAGEYHINVSVSDNRFTTFMDAKLLVNGISSEMAENAVVIRFKHMLPEEFISGYRDSFIDTLKSELGVLGRDIILLSIQPATNTVVTPSREKRSTDSDLDVLVAVQRNKNRYYRSKPLGKRLMQAKGRMEQVIGVEIAKIFNDVCQRDSCQAGDCVTVVHFDNDQVFTIMTDNESYVTARHSLGYKCVCAAGFGGPICQDRVDLCDPSPCPVNKLCAMDTEDDSYTCSCPQGLSGEQCQIDDTMEICTDITCRKDNAMTFSGNSYIRWRLTVPMERRLSLALELKTVQQKAMLMYAVGRVDYSILEIEDGMIQYRFDCGSGEGFARVDTIQINDGLWHSVVVERIQKNVKIIIDGRITAEGSAPGTNDVLNLDSNDVFFGAKVQMLAHGYEDIQTGFIGCMQRIKVDNEELPLTGSTKVGVLQNLRDIEFHCKGTYIPGVCSSSPCSNGGTCLPLGDSYMCQCRKRFEGARCERDKDPCASNPCLHGGTCENLSNDFRCHCEQPLKGKRCEQNFFCAPNPCKNSGNCQDGLSQAICNCQKGFTGDLCQHDIDECQHSPCLNGGTCLNFRGGFLCNCTVEAAGDLCEEVNFPEITSSSRHFNMEEILGIVGVVVALVIAVIVVLLILRWRRRKRQRRQRMSGGGDNRDSTDLYDLQDKKHNTKISNMQHAKATNNVIHNINHHNIHNHHNSPSLKNSRPPPVPTRPASYTPSTADSLNTLNNCNFDIARNYGSAADELENIDTIREPIEIPDFMRNLDVEKSPQSMRGGGSLGPHMRPEEEPLLKQSHMNPDNLNIASNYPYHKKHNKYIPSEPESVQLLQSGDNAGGSNRSLPVSESEDELPGYHWDISDWHPDVSPLPKISEVPTREVPDSPSSSPHSNEENNVPIDPNGYDDTDYPEEFLENDSEYVGDSEYAENECDGPDTDDPDADFPEPPDFQKILALQGAFNDPGEDLQEHNYNMHPDQYLPQYNISENNSQADEPPPESDDDDDDYDDYNGNYSADNIARDDDDDVIYYGFTRPPHQQMVPQDIAGNQYNTLDRRASLMDDMSVSMGGYTSTNVSESDISGLCEIEDSEANLSDNDLELPCSPADTTDSGNTTASQTRPQVHTDV